MNKPSRHSGCADLGRATSPRRALAAAACLAWAATLASSAAFAEPEAHAEAAQAYQRQHFAAALAGYERLAMQGDCEAAERAGLMLLFGQRLYGDAVPRDITRARQWLEFAAQGGSVVARHLLGRSTRTVTGSACGPDGHAGSTTDTAATWSSAR